MASFNCIAVALLASLLALWLPGTVGRINVACVPRNTTRTVTCTVYGWSARNLTQEQIDTGILVNETAPFNNYTFRFVLACDNTFAQTFSLVTKSAYDTCNATENFLGRSYVFSRTRNTEITLVACYITSSESGIVEPSLRYENSTRDEYYAIGTTGAATLANQFSAVRNLVGGACLQGLKLRIILNWHAEQEPEAEMVGPSSASSAGVSTLVLSVSVAGGVLVLVAVVIVAFLFYRAHTRTRIRACSGSEKETEKDGR